MTPPPSPPADVVTAASVAAEVTAASQLDLNHHRVNAAAVDARFPAPEVVSYATPAFEPGRSRFTSNGEMHSLLQALTRRQPGGPLVQLLPLGLSQRGEPIEALLLSRLPRLAPASVRAAARPTVLVVAQQHGDAPAGAEAVLVLAQQLVEGDLRPLLERINVVLLPRANPDGAANGQHETANGLDLDRDHLLLYTPEAQAQARLVREYRPAVVVDAQEYGGLNRFVDKFDAFPGSDALVQYAAVANLPGPLTLAAERWFRVPLQASLSRAGLRTEWYHETTLDPADKRVTMGSPAPDSVRNANGLRHAISLLVASRGAGLGREHFARRVHTHVTALRSVLYSAAEHAGELRRLRLQVDRDVTALACQGRLVTQAGLTPQEYVLSLIDPQSGEDKTFTVAWESALTLTPLQTKPRPCGYWLDAAQVDAVQRLRALGVKVDALQADMPGLRTDPPVPATRLRAGSYYVGLNQPLAHLAVAALEQGMPYSYGAHRVVTDVEGVARVMKQPAARQLRPL